MKVTVDLAAAKPRLTEAYDFARLQLEVAGADESDESRRRLADVLEGASAGRLADAGAQIDLRWLTGAGPATDADWLQGVAGLIDDARRRGRVRDEDGSLAAHVEWVPEQHLSEAHYRRVLGHFPTGVAVVTADTDAGLAGFSCQSFSAVSIDPPLVLLCVGASSTTWPKIRSAGRLAINVLAEHQAELCAQFGRNVADRFAGVAWRPGPSTGAPLIDDAVSWFEGTIESETPAGDHTVVIVRLLSLRARSDGEPLVFLRGSFRGVRPPAEPAAASAQR